MKGSKNEGYKMINKKIKESYNNIENNTSINNIKFENILTIETNTSQYLDNTFCLFNSIDNIIYLIYSNNNCSIISYNLIDNKKINVIKKAHDSNISNFRHYYDKNNKRDLILSISSKENNIKLWNINNWECLLNILKIYAYGEVFSACFLNENNNIYIITSDGSSNFFPIKVFDLNGNKIKEINNSNDSTEFIDNYYDKKLNKNYIITGNVDSVKSYDYKENKKYYNYGDGFNEFHYSIIINNNEEIVKLIESSLEGNIKIWNFHNGKLLKKIKVCNCWLNGICLYNDEYLFVGSDDNTMRLVELKKGKIIKTIIGHKKCVISIKKIYHPIYGECLVSQGAENDSIKIWKIKK